MAEKRGQYQYNDDGSISQLVHNTNETAENSVIAIDHQATLTNTAVTHTSVVIAPSTSNAQSAWQQVPEGMTEFMNNLVTDLNVGNVVVNVSWSEDGTNLSGRVNNSITNITASAKSSTQWFPVGGAFYKSEIVNGHTAPITGTSNIKFRP